MAGKVCIKRALISVWDKKGIVEFASYLASKGVEIVSTGGTYRLLKEQGIAVQEVAEMTGFPEIMHGRVKTLHPSVHGGLLADKANPEHMEQIKKLGIKPFDMVVVNLYPFTDMLKKDLSFAEMVEYIDIGGPTMLRAASKNMNSVIVLSDPSQYAKAKKEMEKLGGTVSVALCKECAANVFEQTYRYDMAIASYLSGQKREALVLSEKQSLRYGENPHQKAGLFVDIDAKTPSFKQLNGKELSFNNLLDANAAVLMVREYDEPASVVIKHTIPCGAAIGKNAADAYKKAYAADPLSSFGGIIAFNVNVDKAAAKAVCESGFRELVIAPSFDQDAIALFEEKKNLRVIAMDFSKIKAGKDIKKTVFGYLVEEEDTADFEMKDLKVVTKKKPTAKQMQDLLFAWKLSKHVKSNAIVVAKDRAALGVGGGFTARVDAGEYAYAKSLKSTKGAVVGSDAFFPYPDNVEIAAKSGIAAIIQPGGSVKDPEVIAACDTHGIAMVFTGMRHFKH